MGANEQSAAGERSPSTDRTAAGFLSCLFCGLGPADRVVPDLGDLARTVDGWRCADCGGQEAWFLPTSAGVPAVVRVGTAAALVAAPPAAGPPVHRSAPGEPSRTVPAAEVVRC